MSTFRPGLGPGTRHVSWHTRAQLGARLALGVRAPAVGVIEEDNIPPGAIEEAQRNLGSMDSVGQARMVSLASQQHARRYSRDLEVYPNLWAGVGLVRGGAGTALIGR